MIHYGKTLMTTNAKKKKKKNEWEISVIKAVEINAFLITIFDEKDITQQLLI